MTPAPDKPRASRTLRQGEVFGKLGRLAAILAVLVAGVTVGFCLLVKRLERSPPVHPDYVKKQGTVPDAKSIAAIPVQGIADLEEKRPLIEAALRVFFQAATVEDKLVVSRDADRVRPLMTAYYEKTPLRPRTLAGLGNCQSVSEKNRRLGYVQVQFAQGNPVSVIVEEAADGSFHADWESLVRYSEMEWLDFLRKRPKEPVLMRVIASQVTLPEAQGFEWLEVSSPGLKTIVQAYFDRKDPKFQPLIEQLDLGGGKNVPLTLRLCYSEPKLKADAVCIAEVEGKGWLILN